MFGFETADVALMSGWPLYLTIFLLPFIQEDVAVIAASTASLVTPAPDYVLFMVILAGLTGSDIWKYWIGALARKNAWAHRFAEKPGVSVAGDLVKSELVKTLFVARYVPGTRIPTYIACGFFKVHYPRFVAIMILTAFTYVTLSFTLFHTVGAVAGEQAKIWLPIIAVTLVVCYVLYRWLRHRNNRAGPMTPLSEAFDHPMPDMPGFEGNPLEAENEQKDGDKEKEAQ